MNDFLEELYNIVGERGKRYTLVLNSIAEGASSWGRLKRCIEEKEGRITKCLV